jgi:AraC-like DNA-binding protein
MTHRQVLPHPILQDFIKSLWASQRHFQPPHQTFELLPDSYIELIFTFGAPCYIDLDGTWRAVPRCAVIGLLDKPVRFGADGLVQTIGARFFAWGFWPLFHNEIPRDPTPLHPLPAAWHALADRMAQAVERGDLEVAISELHYYLLSRVLPRQGDSTALQEAVRLLQHHHGQVRISTLAAQQHYSLRQLERKFNQMVGTTPKALARRMRFERVRDSLVRDPLANLAALAQECGYADQAHLDREFKHYSKKTPTEFAQEMAALRHWMRESYDVVFLQDPARPL